MYSLLELQNKRSPAENRTITHTADQNHLHDNRLRNLHIPYIIMVKNTDAELQNLKRNIL
jgi:hypothetical protein